MATNFASPAHAYFSVHVEPAFNEWAADETSLRHAMSLAVALNQLADHYFGSFPATDGRLLGAASVAELRSELATRCPAFQLVHDVADAHKHLELSRDDRQVKKAEQTGIGTMGWGEAEFGRGRWGSPPEIVITLNNGRRRHFSAVVRDVMSMWRELIGAP